MGANAVPVVKTYKADAAIGKGKMVTFGTDEDHVAIGSANTDKIIGVTLESSSAAEEFIEVAISGGGKCEAGETIAAGKSVVCDANGDAVQTNASGDWAIGYAMDAAVDGDLFGIQIAPHFALAADK